MSEQDWTGSLIDRLNELVRENRSLFAECRNGAEASDLITQIHGQFNHFRHTAADLQATVATLRQEKERVDKLEILLRRGIGKPGTGWEPMYWLGDGYKRGPFREAIDNTAIDAARQSAPVADKAPTESAGEGKGV